MFRYFLAFLLLSTYSGSSGAPTKNSPISDWLDSLVPNCPNKFLAQQIKDHLEECKVVVPPYRQQQLLCLMFYDISKQLCSASIDHKAALADDYSKKIKDDLDVVTACTQAKNWSVAELKECPDYKKKLQTAFNVSFGCEKLCGVEDITSQDTNFFCRYLQWGSEVLSAPPDAAAKEGENASDPKSPNEIESPPIRNFTDLPTVSEDNTSSALESSAHNGSVTAKGHKAAKTEQDKIPQTDKHVLPEHETSLQKDQNQIVGNGESEVGVGSEPPVRITTTAPGLNQSNKAPDTSANKNPKTDKDGADINADPDSQLQGNNDEKDKHKLNNNDNAGDESDDYSAAPEDQVNEPDDGLVGDETLTQSNQEPGIQNKGQIVDMALENSERGPGNTYAEEYNDDHFFQFFLTGIILVVLLYVLYHNKSKVSKVVLGLIVEGRQPGRRRNSRGHAYKRLDTLEQAMSTNSAAPPSKIIY